jgi:hypothetical protein
MALQRIAKDDDEYEALKTACFSTVAKEALLVPHYDCWQKKTILNFWSDRSTQSPLLADYAIRLATTIANTTISERSFSCLKRTQTRLRSSLTTKRLDKLITIGMNAELLEADGQYRTTKKRKRLDLESLTERDRLIEENSEQQARAALRDAIGYA